MNIRAYLLIEVAVGRTRDVVTALGNIPNMITVDRVTGPYDIIAIVETPDLNAVGQLVTEHVHTITGVSRTITCLTMGSQ